MITIHLRAPFCSRSFWCKHVKRLVDGDKAWHVFGTIFASRREIRLLPYFVVRDKQRDKSACAHTQSDKRLCFCGTFKVYRFSLLRSFRYYAKAELAGQSMALMPTPKTDFLRTGPILYVCVMLCYVYKKHQYLPQFIMFVINHLCHLEPQSHNTCTRLDLSAAHCDQITSVVE